MRYPSRLFFWLSGLFLAPSLLGAQDLHWRYDFTPGQVLRYRHLFDQKELAFGDTFVWTWETAMSVESVDPQGNATIQLTSTRDTLERRGELIRMPGVTVVRPKRMPRIRVVVSPTGLVGGGEIIEASEELIELRKRQSATMSSRGAFDDSTVAAREAEYWFYRLPRLPLDAALGSTWSDTTYERRMHAGSSGGSHERITISERIDTTISSYRIAGFRSINGINTLKVVQTRTFQISLGSAASHHWSGATELYFDVTNGLLVRREETLVHTSGDALGTVQKYVVELISAGQPAPPDIQIDSLLWSARRTPLVQPIFCWRSRSPVPMSRDQLR